MAEVAVLAKKAASALLPLIRAGLAALAKGLVMGQSLTLVAMLIAVGIGSRNGEIAARLVSALLVGVIGTVTTVIFASKRAVFAVIEAALKNLALGTTLFRAVFSRLVGVSDEPQPDAPQGALANAIEERLPLAQAEQRLKSVVAQVTREDHQFDGMRGWLLTKARASLLGLVAQVTLARFRDDHRKQGAVDLRRVRDELGMGLDALLIEKVSGLSSRSTYLAVGLAVVTATLSTSAIYWYWSTLYSDASDSSVSGTIEASR
jgi:hypothetical protein